MVVNAPINLGSSTSYGVSSTLKDQVSKSLDLTLQADLHHATISAPLSFSAFGTSSHDGIDGKLIADYVLTPKDQFSGNVSYQGRQYGLGYTAPARWQTNLQYSHKFARGLTALIDLVNLGVPETWSQNFAGPGYRQISTSRQPTRAVKASLSKTF